MKPKTSLIILDRDGVINHDSDDYIKSPDEWIPIPGALEAIAALNRAQIPIAIATNQSGIGRGLYSLATLNHIHDKMHLALSAVVGHVDGIFFCPHTPTDGCDCRKPLPGLLYQIEKTFQIPLAQAIMVGDSLRDIQAARAAGCAAAWVQSGKPLSEENWKMAREWGVPVFKDLADFVQNGLLN